jgi:hypothetical protein
MQIAALSLPVSAARQVVCAAGRAGAGEDWRMISFYERRRRDPLYFQFGAANALRAARLLEDSVLDAFRREASLSLELITKAVIAQRLQVGEDLGTITKVPVSHNVPKLWTEARLPALLPDDHGRLIQARVYLMWAGRYPAPNRDEDGERDEADLLEHGTSLFRTRTPRTFNWDDVERIYSTANHYFIEIRIAHGLSRPDGSIVIV